MIPGNGSGWLAINRSVWNLQRMAKERMRKGEWLFNLSHLREKLVPRIFKMFSAPLFLSRFLFIFVCIFIFPSRWRRTYVHASSISIISQLPTTSSHWLCLLCLLGHGVKWVCKKRLREKERAKKSQKSLLFPQQPDNISFGMHVRTYVRTRRRAPCCSSDGSHS